MNVVFQNIQIFIGNNITENGNSVVVDNSRFEPVQFFLIRMQGTVLMQAKNDVNLYYLAVHLDENSFSDYALAEGKDIKPGDRIAKIGVYPAGDHLHVSVIKLENGESSKMRVMKRRKAARKN